MNELVNEMTEPFFPMLIDVGVGSTRTDTSGARDEHPIHAGEHIGGVFCSHFFCTLDRPFPRVLGLEIGSLCQQHMLIWLD